MATISLVSSDVISGFANITRSLTIASGRILVVCIGGDSTRTVSGVTFNSVALTQIAQSTGTYWSEIWYLLNPPATTANLVVTTSGGGYITVSSSWWKNVSQIGGSVTASSRYLTIASGYGYYVIDSMGWRADDAPTKPSNATVIGKNNPTGAGASYAASAGATTTMNWTGTATNPRHCGVNLVPTGGQFIRWSK